MFSEIEHRVTLVLADRSPGGVPVPAVLAYRRQDPFAIRLTFPGICGPDGPDLGDLTWLLSRELLEAGLTAPVGEGDVRVVPTTSTAIRLHLRSGAAEAVLEAPRPSVEHFLRACGTCVPPGEESTVYDWDHAWTDVLGRERS
ncbi:hypothetical protein ABH931_004742 [Streptacidiphilus sp. MAP12-33]|uniref:SsgA family sporulation/cell division regulator n=1 Tax=Streptacidiphilus sp. MAP12-33 TaxID=3156266 RepID=UPI0035183251